MAGGTRGNWERDRWKSVDGGEVGECLGGGGFEKNEDNSELARFGASQDGLWMGYGVWIMDGYGWLWDGLLATGLLDPSSEGFIRVLGY